MLMYCVQSLSVQLWTSASHIIGLITYFHVVYANAQVCTNRPAGESQVKNSLGDYWFSQIVIML